MSVNRALRICLAYVIDRFLGDPEGFPHPVRLMGRCIGILEKKLSPEDSKAPAAIGAGCAIAATMAGGSWLFARMLLALPGDAFTETLLLYTTFAGKDLEKSSLRVAWDLEAADIASARRDLRALVGRETDGLDEGGVCRAAVESLAENCTDGVLAPLFWAAVGGAPAAMAFKAVSTLDSMIGHRDEKYRRLGWCSARLDDLAVLPAARLSIPLVALAAFLAGYDYRSAWRIGLRDRGKHASPNSAHAEAAFAGSLGLRLGGPDTYAGARRELPEIGEGTREAKPRHIRDAARLMNAASLLGLGLALLWASRAPRNWNTPASIPGRFSQSRGRRPEGAGI
jgi:adenosylcobinamide-phosphate synthase